MRERTLRSASRLSCAMRPTRASIQRMNHATNGSVTVKAMAKGTDTASIATAFTTRNSVNRMHSSTAMRIRITEPDHEISASIVPIALRSKYCRPKLSTRRNVSALTSTR